MTELSDLHQKRSDKWRDAVAQTFIHNMPFNQLLGIELVHYDAQRVELKLAMQKKLLGNPIQSILHGGVTASILDVAGGMIVAACAIEKNVDLEREELSKRLANMGTIDLRIDYLRPGYGDCFYATAEVIRTGNKVAVARMELHNQDNVHIAFGTGTYLVG